MNEDQLATLRLLLDRFERTNTDKTARDNAMAVSAFIACNPRPWSRAIVEGHLTASAWVLDRTQTHVVMIHHRKLNRWLQPGGHIDDSDASWRSAALRELAEETGLTRFVELSDEECLFDVDVHLIPARKDELAHLHYDLRFLFVADTDVGDERAFRINAEESHDCRWFALAELANDPSLGPETHRMIELSLQRSTATGHS